MTQRHRDRRCDLADDVHRRHDKNWFRKALEIPSETVCLDLVVRDEDKHQNTPCKECVEIICRGIRAGQAHQRADNGHGQNRCDKRNKTIPFRSHIAADQLLCHLHDHFRHDLPFGARMHLHPSCQPDTQSHNDNHCDPGIDNGLCDRVVNAGNDVVYLGAGDGYFHESFFLLSMKDRQFHESNGDSREEHRNNDGNPIEILHLKADEQNRHHCQKALGIRVLQNQLCFLRQFLFHGFLYSQSHDKEI